MSPLVSNQAKAVKTGMPIPSMTTWQGNHNLECSGTRGSAAHDIAADDDGPCVRRCLRGDTDAYATLVVRHEGRVRAIAARILGAQATRDDIDDLSQDIFVQAWRALPRFRADAKFSTWLHRLATNIAIKQWHKRKRGAWLSATPDLPEPVQAGLRDDAPGPSTVAQTRAQGHALRAAIDALPEKQRTVVLLHYFEDYACEEVAQMVGCSVGTVWSRLHYACRKLRGTLAWLGEE